MRVNSHIKVIIRYQRIFPEFLTLLAVNNVIVKLIITTIVRTHAYIL
jgi:hypothetical protein